MQFSVLGSTEVTAGGVQLELGGVKQRAILGYLVVHANKVVPTSQILQAMWEGNPPPTARKMVQNAVSAIRRMLANHADAPALQTHAPGYQLRVDTDTVDLFRFRVLVREGRAAITDGMPAHGVELLRDALSLWRGRALADLVETGICWSELAAIEDERLSALEDRLDAELACGRHRATAGAAVPAVHAGPVPLRPAGRRAARLPSDARGVDRRPWPGARAGAA
jgi:DNA-binding SARP family transcriptional activator